MTIQYQRPAPKRLTYAQIVARQGKTKTGKISRFRLDPVHRAILDAGPKRRTLTVEEQIARHEKYVISLLRPTDETMTRTSDVARAERKQASLRQASETADQLELTGTARAHFITASTRCGPVDSDATRAAKARGHILKASELRTTSDDHYDATPYDVMNRLGLTETEQRRIGPFINAHTWAWS